MQGLSERGGKAAKAETAEAPAQATSEPGK